MRLMRPTVVFLLCILLPLTGGCVSMQTLRLGSEDVSDPGNEEIVGVTTVNGNEIVFDPPSGTFREGFITGTVAGNVSVTALEDVEFFWVRREEIDWGMTALAVIGVALIVVAAVAISQAEFEPGGW